MYRAESDVGCHYSRLLSSRVRLTPLTLISHFNWAHSHLLGAQYLYHLCDPAALATCLWYSFHLAPG